MIILREIVLLALLGALLISDIKRGRLPYWISYLGMALAIVGANLLVRTGQYEWSHAGLGIVAGYLISGLLAMIPGLMTDLSGKHPEKDKLAGEDYALIAMLGAFVGPLAIIAIFLLGVVAGRILAGLRVPAPFTVALVGLTLLMRYLGTPIMGHHFGL